MSPFVVLAKVVGGRHNGETREVTVVAWDQSHAKQLGVQHVRDVCGVDTVHVLAITALAAT